MVVFGRRLHPLPVCLFDKGVQRDGRRWVLLADQLEIPTDFCITAQQ